VCVRVRLKTILYYHRKSDRLGLYVISRRRVRVRRRELVRVRKCIRSLYVCSVCVCVRFVNVCVCVCVCPESGEGKSKSE
jgi:hypothetical protein